jgi:hypothetical protein
MSIEVLNEINRILRELKEIIEKYKNETDPQKKLELYSKYLELRVKLDNIINFNFNIE